MDGNRELADLRSAAEERYLSYALSVITARALPDVRDGLKPVQRRILYAMYRNLRLLPGAKPRKSAQIVGEVIGKYHPHGDAAAYDAMVRMAQDFALRYPLVHGEGNFGSLDGDGAAAYRYTEARLTPIAEEMLADLDAATVGWRPNYDATLEEPVVLPTRLPQLLVNGCSGIAVGMATNIPPHNLREVVDTLVALIDRPRLDVAGLLEHIRGPDFPTGGELLSGRAELLRAYETGHGQLRLRGEYRIEPRPRGRSQIVLRSIPYGVNKASLVEQIAGLVTERRLPQLVDVRDESTDRVRIVLELRSGASAEAAMAYLFKHTDLQVNVAVNLTVLRAAPGAATGQPGRVSLKDLCRDFLDFRMSVVVRRLEHEREQLAARLHVLDGFVAVYGDLDQAIRIIRRAESRADAAAGLERAFGLDRPQVDAILELRLYQLARLEIERIRTERREKRKRLAEVRRLLAQPRARWKLIREELLALRERYGDARRTRVSARGREDLAYDPDAYVVHEETTVLVSRDGWIRRVRELRDPSSARLRDGDALAAVLVCSTRDRVAFFTSAGLLYVLPVASVPPTSGYGEPVQSFFRFGDGERLLGALLVRVPAGADREGDSGQAELFDAAADQRRIEGTAVLVASARGYGFRTTPDLTPTTRSGRRLARVSSGDEIVSVQQVEGPEVICLARSGRGVRFPLAEVAELAGPGRGVLLMRLEAGDRLVAARAVGPGARLRIRLEAGDLRAIRSDAVGAGHRGNKGSRVVKRGRVAGLEPASV